MAELYYDEAKGDWAVRQLLRSPYIDYFHGWFFVTFQVVRNKSALGAIVGEECVLNALGAAIRDAWLNEPAHVTGHLELSDFQVMPNHFHALLYYDATGRGGPVATRGVEAPTPPAQCGLKPREQVAALYARDPNAHDLPYVIGLFKSWTTTLYHRLKAAGKCLDLGPKLWQESFYDELVRSAEQFDHTAAYIRNNPRNWNLDRFGAVTSYAEGNLALLQSDYVAYLSSEGYDEGTAQGKVPMRPCVASAPTGRSGPVATQPCGDRATAPGRSPAKLGPSPAAPKPPIISTFTSFYERQILERCLRVGRRFIWVCSGGIDAAVRAKAAPALASGQALLLSPVAPDTGINKQRANWCNQFIAKNAAAVWLGHLRPGGSLESILKGCGFVV